MFKFDKRELWPLAVIALTIAVSAAAYPYLPDRVATHWNAAGIANGWSGRLSAVILTPFIMILLHAILTAVPAIDPLRANIASFSGSYRAFRIWFLAALAWLHLVILANGAGLAVNVGSAVMLMMAAVFGSLARLLPRTRRNYTIGIRLPWTLESDRVWDETHRFGGKAFAGLAAAAAIGALLPGRWAIGVFFVALVAVLAAVCVFAYRRHEFYAKEKNGPGR